MVHTDVVMQGAVLCARFAVDSPYALAVGGTKNGFQIIDVRQLEAGTDMWNYSTLGQTF